MYDMQTLHAGGIPMFRGTYLVINLFYPNYTWILSYFISFYDYKHSLYVDNGIHVYIVFATTFVTTMAELSQTFEQWIAEAELTTETC